MFGNYYISAYYVDSNILTHDEGTIKIKPIIDAVGESKYISRSNCLL